jgi:hypothetical protein
MTKPINVKVVCACGKEVNETEKEEKLKQIEMLLLQGRMHNVSFETLAKELCAFFEEDRPAESERWQPKRGDYYWVISEEDVDRVLWQDHDYDLKRLRLTL